MAINESIVGAHALKKKRLPGWETIEPFLKILVVLSGMIIIALAIQKGILFNFDFQYLLKMKSPFFRYLFIINGIIFVGALVFRTFLWFRYRPYDSKKVEEWPEITVLVPAYNEGQPIYTTISSIAESDYPAGKLKIIAVDDGSGDDTFSYMEKARDLYPDMVELIRFEKNMGKREGIYRTFLKSNSPFVVTVDSDTRVEPKALKELITPLVLNPKLGAVTGRIRIWNSDANVFTKMLKANFAMAFDFTRAVQSTFSSVFCTSGAFSAYRVTILNQIIDPWMEQRFLGQKCTYGEDRSLANHILRTGFGTAFQRTAIAFTVVPENFPKIMKMLTRWARSNIRESLVFSGLMFNHQRKGNYLLPFIEFFSTIFIVFIHIIMFYYFLFTGLIDGGFIARLLVYSILFGFFYMLYYIRIEGSRDFPYVLIFSLFSSIFMIWIFTAAGATITKKTWSTR